MQCKNKNNVQKRNQETSMNHVRLQKQATLPCEVLGLRGDKLMGCGTQNQKKSMVPCKVKLPKVQKPSKGCFIKWNKIISWLRATQVVKNLDFMKHAANKQKVSEEKIALKITE